MGKCVSVPKLTKSLPPLRNNERAKKALSRTPLFQAVPSSLISTVDRSCQYNDKKNTKMINAQSVGKNTHRCYRKQAQTHYRKWAEGCLGA